MKDVADRAEAVRSRIQAAADRAGRDPEAVRLVAVTKGHTEDAAQAAIAAGLEDLGENRVADLAERAAAFPAARWHMIGRLQTNKVRLLPVRLAAIHSVDRPSLVDRLARVEWEGPPPQLYVQVNVAGETQKGGVRPDQLDELLALLGDRGLPVSGLMTVAPAVVHPEEVRPVFAELAGLAAERGVSELSMGMSDDFEVAVEEGSTLVRVGRAIFSAPPLSEAGRLDFPRH